MQTINLNPNLLSELFDLISQLDSELKFNFHLNPKDREITLTW